MRSSLSEHQSETLPGRPDRSLREHAAIVEAIASGDGDAAERTMRRHLSHVAGALRARAAADSAAAAPVAGSVRRGSRAP